MEDSVSQFMDYLDNRLNRKDKLLENKNDRIRMLLKTERGELEVIRLKFMKVFGVKSA